MVLKSNYGYELPSFPLNSLGLCLQENLVIHNNNSNNNNNKKILDNKINSLSSRGSLKSKVIEKGKWQTAKHKHSIIV